MLMDLARPVAASAAASAAAKPLAGRVAVVTGSTSGIGLGIARAFAQAGAAVVLNGLGKVDDVGEILAALSAEYGVRGIYSPADMGKPESIARMIDLTLDTYGRLDILVNNAGIQFVSPVEEFPEEKWDAVIAINLSSNFHAIKAALPGMRRRNWGRIVNIASAHGLVASPDKAAYVAAKHGVVGLTKVVAIETARTPITCNAICPGFVRTPLAEVQVQRLARDHGVSEERALTDLLLVHQPSKRWIEVEEVARMALYLCGPDSGGVTGAALSIDGGWFAS
jgi:3-hydroxybutyrate dehydrogenase